MTTEAMMIMVIWLPQARAQGSLPKSLAAMAPRDWRSGQNKQEHTNAKRKHNPVAAAEVRVLEWSHQLLHGRTHCPQRTNCMTMQLNTSYCASKAL